MPDTDHPIPRRPSGAGDALHGPDSVAKSDGYARPILERLAHFEPEIFAPIGVPGADEKIMRLPPDWPRQKLEAYEEAIRALGEYRDAESHPAVRLDLESMITFLSWELDLKRREAELTIPYFNLAQTIVLGLLTLPPERTRQQRPAAALRRLRRYAGLEEGYVPLPRQAEALIRAGLDRHDRLGPWRETVLRDLAGARTLLAELPRLFEERRITGHDRALDVLRRQLAAYGCFLRREVLPRCRDDFRLPPELYEARLRRFGVEMPIAELSHRAEAAFGGVRRQLETSARRLASRRGWSSARDERGQHFPGVLRRLKRERLAPGEILDHYGKRQRQLEALIRAADFVSLPCRRQFAVRLASEAENAVLPFPHFRLPSFFGNQTLGQQVLRQQGEVGEIVLPLISEQAEEVELPGDAYASRAISWAVAGHEGFPGHALQISRLLESDVPLARGPLAFNHAALEGWAVYAESEICPDLSLEARLPTLHSQLRHAAGAFLDPGLQQGRFTREQAKGLLLNRVGLSAKEADQALWRYTAWSPGQAASYFCGHAQLAALRTAVECRLGSAFDRREYHDFLLAQGLLPLSLLRRWVLEQLGSDRRLAA